LPYKNGEKILQQHTPNTELVVQCFKQYIEYVAEAAPSYKQYMANMELKMQDAEFLTDVLPLLRPEIQYNAETAWNNVYNTFINYLPGRRD